jgi:peptide/nickel transport system substrate-binding protein
VRKVIQLCHATPTATTTTTPISPSAPTCFIATAAYDSELTPEVQFLRSFRDGKVMRTIAGSQFMAVFNAWYYSFSPYIARFIANNQPLRIAVKAGLYPLIGILRLSAQIYDPLSFNPEAAVITAGLVASFLIGLIYLSPITTLIMWSIAKRKLMPKLKQLNLVFITIWLLSLSLILFGELVASSQMLMLATSMFVTLTLFSPTLIAINLIYKKW